MTGPEFTLTVATSEDGLISPTIDTPTDVWASAEEQALFFADIEASDWAIMGRHTHEAADKPERRRIVFSSRIAGWQRPTQLWLDPAGLTPGDLAERVQDVRPLRRGLILGGTRVHDWFLSQDAIHRIHLTVEPVTFGDGLPVFSDQQVSDPVEIFTSRGFVLQDQRRLNAAGTRFYDLAAPGRGRLRR